MGWLWKAFGGGGGGGDKSTKPKRRNAPSMTRQTSVRIQQFHSGQKKTGSLVLSKEDLKAVQIQSKIEQTRRKIEHQEQNYQDELQVLRRQKEALERQLDQKWEEGLEGISEYQLMIQEQFLEDALLLAEPGNGMKEAELFKALHKSDLQEKVRVRFQQQASDELMEVYKTTPKFKEQMGEREAKMLSVVFQKDALVAQRKELNETILRIQTEMIKALEKATQEQFQKRYEAIRDGNDAEDGDLVTRRQLAGTRSYSSRILGEAAGAAVSSSLGSSPSSESPPEMNETTNSKPSMEVGMKDVILEEDDPSGEAHIGEVKTTKTDPRRTASRGATSRSPTRQTASRSKSPTAPFSAGASASNGSANGNARRGELGSKTAATTTRVRARPAPPSARGGGRSANRSPTTSKTTQQQTGSELAAARRATGERARQETAPAAYKT